MNTLFLACFLAGLGLSVVSFVSGLDKVNLFDHIFGHGHHLGGHHHARVRAGKSISPFNMAALTAFVTWFGGGGVVFDQITTWSSAALIAAAVATGAVGGSAVNRFLRTLVRSERPLQSEPMYGTAGRITVPIRAGGTGEVVFTLGGTRHVAAARTEDDTPLQKGTEVFITREERGIAYVRTRER
jgi:hypothetical protein